jgi:hypothetical protein
MLGAVTSASDARTILESLGLDAEAPRIARARDPTDLDHVA